MKKLQKVEHTYNKMIDKQGPAKCVSVSYNKLVRDNIINIIANNKYFLLLSYPHSSTLYCPF